jgi:hypothetical protein
MAGHTTESAESSRRPLSPDSAVPVRTHRTKVPGVVYDPHGFGSQQIVVLIAAEKAVHSKSLVRQSGLGFLA